MKAKTKTPQRVGIYSGTFDPVHAGHVSFALQALKAAKLDVIYFLPERRPRTKTGIEHFGHRVAMLKRATTPHKHLRVLETEDVSFSVANTLPRLRKRFPKDQLVFLVGSDVVEHMPVWPNVEQLLKQSELLIGIRADATQGATDAIIAGWNVKPQATTIIDSYAATVSSQTIRAALRRRQHAPGLLRSVERYSDSNWLYVSVA